MRLARSVVVLFVLSLRAASVTCRPAMDDVSGSDLRTLSEQMLKLLDVEHKPHLTESTSSVPDYMTVLYRDIEDAKNSHNTPHSGSVWGLQLRAGELLIDRYIDSVCFLPRPLKNFQKPKLSGVMFGENRLLMISFTYVT